MGIKDFYKTTNICMGCAAHTVSGYIMENKKMLENDNAQGIWMNILDDMNMEEGPDDDDDPIRDITKEFYTVEVRWWAVLPHQGDERRKRWVERLAAARPWMGSMGPSRVLLFIIYF